MHTRRPCLNLHLVVEDLGLAGGGVGNQGLVKNVKDILADLLELALNLVAVLADGANMLLAALGLLLLLDRGDDAPAGAAGAHHVLVGDRKEVALIDGKFTTELGDLLHVRDHLIVSLSLLAKASEESLAANLNVLSVYRHVVEHVSQVRSRPRRTKKHTFRAGPKTKKLAGCISTSSDKIMLVGTWL